MNPEEEYPMTADTQTRPPHGTPPAAPPTGPAGPSAWRVVGVLTTVAVILLGVLSVASWLVRKTEMVDRAWQHAVARIVVDSGSGTVILTPGGEGRVTLHEQRTWSWNRPVDRTRWDGDTLRVSHDCSAVDFGPGCSVDYGLRVPAGVVVEVRTGSGDVTARDLTGPVTLDTGSGDVTGSGLSGALRLHTGSGDVTADGLGSGPVVADTGSGDVALEFGTAPGQVAAATGTGDVTLVVPRGTAYRVRTETGSGDASVTVAQDPAAAATLTTRTGSGDVTIRNP
jgi:hypothetical protein